MIYRAIKLTIWFVTLGLIAPAHTFANVNQSSPSDLAPIQAENIKSLDALLANATPLPVAMANSENFNLALTLAPSGRAGLQKIHQDDYSIAKTQAYRVFSLPQMQLSLNVMRGIVSPENFAPFDMGHPYWELLLQRGQVYRSPQLPSQKIILFSVALRERGANCTHNGLMAVTFAEDKITSDLYFRFNSETCAYFQFDFKGSQKIVDYRLKMFAPSAGSTPAPDPALSLESELAKKLELPPHKYRQLAPLLKKDNLTIYGLIIDGVEYRSQCLTRGGHYPLCQYNLLPSYSMAKGLFAGLVMMRLEKLYPGVVNEPVGRWVDDCDTKEWRGVQLNHLAHMTTGLFNSADFKADESDPKTQTFFLTPDHPSKVKFACQVYRKQAKPGSQFVYHSTDTYLLGSALSAFMKNKRPAENDLFDDIWLADILASVPLSESAHYSLRTEDSIRQVFAGYGLTFIPRDITQLERYIRHQVETQNAAKYFDPALFSETFLPKNDDGLLHYRNGFWHMNIQQKLDCSSAAPVYWLSGYGGIGLIFFPNGISYYFFGDEFDFSWFAIAKRLHEFRPMCH